MTSKEARNWLVKLSLIVSGTFIAFMLIAPALGYPLTWSEAQQLMQVVIPVFAGYLGTATAFLLGKSKARELPSDNPALMKLLVKGPVIIFAAGMIVSLSAFYLSNSELGRVGESMSIEQLGWGISVLLGLLTVTTNALIMHLFGGQE